VVAPTHLPKITDLVVAQLDWADRGVVRPQIEGAAAFEIKPGLAPMIGQGAVIDTPRLSGKPCADPDCRAQRRARGRRAHVQRDHQCRDRRGGARQFRFQKDPLSGGIRSSSMNTSTARLERVWAPRIKLDGWPSLERSWRTALAPRPSGRAKRQSAKLARCVLSQVWMLPPSEVLLFKHAQVAKPFGSEILIDSALDLATRRASGRTGH
jgi:hypothetical protein